MTVRQMIGVAIATIIITSLLVYAAQALERQKYRPYTKQDCPALKILVMDKTAPSWAREIAIKKIVELDCPIAFDDLFIK